MKLGTETGSLVNHLYSRAVVGQPEPVVGMGATILMWTDRHAATIIEVWTDASGWAFVTVQADHAKRTDQNGQSESQTYEYSANPNGAKRTWRQVEGGTWQEVELGATKRWKKTGGPGLRIGEREEYRDPCF